MEPTPEQPSPIAALEAELGGLPHVDAERFGSLALLDRVETKFLFQEKDLPDLIRALGGDHGLPPANGALLSSYHNLYFETPTRTFYHQHHRGLRPRFKVRIRHYRDRQVSVLDLKRKTNHDVTHKTQLHHPFGDDELQAVERRFIQEHAPVAAEDLEPQVEIGFERITLLGLQAPDRITIDLGLSFAGLGREQSLPGLAILEIKQARFSPRSPAMLVMRERGIRPTRISKYCTAQIHLDPTVQQNRFLGLKRTIRRLTHA